MNACRNATKETLLSFSFQYGDMKRPATWLATLSNGAETFRNPHETSFSPNQSIYKVTGRSAAPAASLPLSCGFCFRSATMPVYLQNVAYLQSYLASNWTLQEPAKGNAGKRKGAPLHETIFSPIGLTFTSYSFEFYSTWCASEAIMGAACATLLAQLQAYLNAFIYQDSVVQVSQVSSSTSVC
jgi:hypothetical protein